MWVGFGQDFFGWIRAHHSLEGRALEVGCTVGAFVALARRLGLDAEGVDIDCRAVDVGCARGLPLRAGTIADCEGPYDLVFCNHVLEHIAEPEPFLSEVRAILRPGGAFVAAMPFRGLEARVKGARWMGWGPQAHYWLYSRRGLSDLIRRSRFEVRRIEVRNGAPLPFTFYKGSLTLLAKYLARGLVRRVADGLGSGDQIFLLAVRPPDAPVATADPDHPGHGKHPSDQSGKR